jgi:hypothetical protein
MMKRNNCNPTFIRVFATVLLALGQAAVAGPGRPGPIKVSEVTANNALIQWSSSDAGEGSQVIYEIQLRRRLDGGPTEWYAAAKAIKTGVAVDGLKPGQLYEVRVRGWVDNVAGLWQIKEHAFKTLGGDHNEGHDDGEGEGDREGNDGEGGEVDLRVAWVKGEAEADVAVLWWQLMGDAEGKLAYDVQLRPRIEGKAGEWEHAAETTHRKVKVDGLKAGTDYDVRVRAWHEKKPGPWKVREHVFRTIGGAVEGGDDGELNDEGEGDGDKETSGPVIAWIKAGASDKIAEIGWRLLREFDREVIFEVQIRERAGEEVGEWRHEAETAKRGIHVDGLHPNTTYDARVRGWLGDKPGEWKIREAAFRTKQTGKEDGQPDEGGEDGQAGVPEIAQIKADDIGPRAGVAKWDLVHEMDAKVGYDVQIRIRVEGKAEEWKHEAETAKNSIIIDGLKPDTLYEIRVRPWANKKAGEWKVLEHAFKTRKGEDGDGEGEKGDGGEHEDGNDGEGEKGDGNDGEGEKGDGGEHEDGNDGEGEKGDGNDGEGEKGDGGEHEGGDDGESPEAPSQPGVIKVRKVTPNSALIHWGASKVQGETKAVYDVQIRQRLAGKPTEWRYVGESFKTEFAVGKLEPGTLYEVRVRAWANKTPGPWQIKEHAFTTGGGEGEQTMDHAGNVGFQVIPGGKMRLTWPAGRGRFVVESTESIAGSSWATVDIRPVQISQVMVADLPIGETGMRFFRVRN